MIYIDVDKKKWEEMAEYHEEYIVKTVPENWERILRGLGLQEKNVLKELFFQYGFEIPDSKSEYEEKREKLKELIRWCTSADIDKLAEKNRENLFDKICEIDEKGVKTEICGRKEKRYIQYLIEILGYKNFSDNTVVMMNNGQPWNRHSFMAALGIKVCPYCNRQYITSYGAREKRGKRKIRTTTDTDHYYPKSQFPLLSMNLYNMIPSCQICNSRMKLNKVHSVDERHLYPYTDTSNSLQFQVKFDSLEELYNFSESDICIELIVSDRKTVKKKAEQSKKIFKLEEVYEAHTDEVFRLKERMKQYSAKGYEKIFCKNYTDIFGGYNEFFEILYPFLTEDEKNVPLTKMKTDIYHYLERRIGREGGMLF